MTRNPVVLIGFLLALTGCAPAPDTEQVQTSAHIAVAELPGAMEQLRTLRQPDNDARREAILALLRAAGFEPHLQEVPNTGREGDPREFGQNIIVELGDGDRDLVIGGHYDSVGVGEGMVDNGASIIVLLHAMQAMRDQALPFRVRFVLFDLEEVGLVGARYFAESVDTERTLAMINLDVNGYGDTVFYGHTAHGHAHLYEALARSCGAQFIRCVDYPRYPPSDNLAFERAGLPNISLSVLPAAEVHQLWLLMNQRESSGLAQGFLPGVFLTIHTQGDVLARIEPGAMALSYNALMGLVEQLAAVSSR